MKSVNESYLFILPWTLESVGGVTEVVSNLMRQMERIGDYKPLLMVNSWEDTKIRNQKIKNQEHHFFRLRNPWNPHNPFINIIIFCLFFTRNIFRLNRFLLANNVAVINVHYGGLYALNIIIAKFFRLFRGKLILSFHGMDLIKAKRTRGFERILWKVMLRSVDTIVAPSESLKNDLILFGGRSENSVFAVHNGIDDAFFQKKRDKNYNIDPTLERSKFILNVATFEYKKGQDILVKAFAQVKNSFSDAQLVMVGRSGEFLDSLKELVRSSGLDNCVWFFEDMSHDKLVSFYEKATVFALPSRYEPFGIVILEAGVFGLPVAATRVGGIKEILNHDQTGRLCQPDDSEKLAKELAYLLEHPDERRRLGNNLRMRVVENFSWEKAYLKYVNCVGD